MSESKRGTYVAPTIKAVQLESSVALKIVKESEGSFPNPTAGPLLGTDVHGELLKISHSYKFPIVYHDQSPLRNRTNLRYQEELLTSLKETQVSAQLLGWYQTSQSGKFITDAVIETLAYAQLKTSPNTVLIIHDPSKASYGILNLKAFRLSKAFLETYIENKFTVENLNKNELTYNNIFEELPVSIHNNHLISLYLSQSGDSNKFDTSSSLESSSIKNKITLNNIENLLESVDELQNFYYQLNRKKQQQQQQQPSSSNSNIPSDANLFELLPLSQKINYTAEDIEQTVLSQFLVDSAIRP
ncbi:hypothetical protein WICMUC_003415 [Wickerhamomyces mucosus]|uniref:MPN domain-containing protein n=1 Tax=Wickerhamomyces mucosus TaxID=1378264 RepID=A0A9P8PMY5_9ASCO|nr:hypothetical protein WICMUC_003415 [Wickerhamomyces mucosus]